MPNTLVPAVETPSQVDVSINPVAEVASLTDGQRSILRELETRDLSKQQQGILAELKSRDIGPSKDQQGVDSSTSPFSAALGTAGGREKTKDFLVTLAKVAPEMSLSAVGAALGFAAGGPLGAAGGASLGAAGGNALVQFLQSKDLFPGVPPGTPIESLKEITLAGGLGLVGEGVGQGIAKTVGKVLSPFGSRKLPRADRLQRILKAENKSRKASDKLTISPASIVDSGFLDFLDNASRSAFIGTTRLRNSLDKNVKFFSGKIEDFARNFKEIDGDVGTLFQDVVGNSADAHSSVASQLYKNLDETLKANQVAKKNIVSIGSKQVRGTLGEPVLKPMFKETDEILEGGVTMKTLKDNVKVLESSGKRFNEATEQVFEWIKDEPDIISFSQAHDLRSDLLKVSRKGTDTIKGQTEGFAKGFAGRLDSEMTSSLREIQKKIPASAAKVDVEKAWREANEFFKVGKQDFNGRVIKSIINSDPEVALNKVIGARDKGSVIRQVRKVLIDDFQDLIKKSPNLNEGQRQQLQEAIKEGKELFENFQGAWFNKMVADATDINGNLSSKVLINNARNFNGKRALNEGPLKALFPDNKHNRFISFAKDLEQIQRPLPEGTGKVFIQLKQPGAAEKIGTAAVQIAVGAGAKAATGGLLLPSVIIFGPAAVSQAFTRPRITNFIINGIKTGQVFRESTTFMTRLSALLNSQGIKNRLSTDDGFGDFEVPEGQTESAASPFSGLAQQIADRQ